MFPGGRWSCRWHALILIPVLSCLYLMARQIRIECPKCHVFTVTSEDISTPWSFPSGDPGSFRVLNLEKPHLWEGIPHRIFIKPWKPHTHPEEKAGCNLHLCVKKQGKRKSRKGLQGPLHGSSSILGLTGTADLSVARMRQHPLSRLPSLVLSSTPRSGSSRLASIHLSNSSPTPRAPGSVHM